MRPRRVSRRGLVAWAAATASLSPSLRAVLAGDGNIDAEEARTLAALVESLGLPDADAAPLMTEEVMPVDRLDVYGEVDPEIARALLRGA
jgi:hypothetical protein